MEKEYLTYEEALQELGIKRSTLYTMITELGINPRKFKYDKKRYLAASDIKRMKEIRETPWKSEENQSEPEKGVA
jgi:predicted DNA-binding transcriptional regulator AlpA